MSLCNPFWHFFCKSIWHFTIFPKPLPKSDSHMHHTHAPSENEFFPPTKPPAWTSFLSFFPALFRSSFRHFCHVLCDFYFSFQVPKPPVFAAFRLFQGYPDADSFSFFKTKNLISGGIPWNKVSGSFMVFLISFFSLSFGLAHFLLRHFPGFPVSFWRRKSSKGIAKKVAKEPAPEHRINLVPILYSTLIFISIWKSHPDMIFVSSEQDYFIRSPVR